MVQPLTPELRSALKDTLQVGDQAVAGEMEIDWVLPGHTEVGVYQDLALAAPSVTAAWTLDDFPDDGHTAAYIPHSAGASSGDPISSEGYSDPNQVRDGNHASYMYFSVEPTTIAQACTISKRVILDLGAAAEVHQARNLVGSSAVSLSQTANPTSVLYSDDGSTWLPAAGAWSTVVSGTETWRQFDLTSPITARYWAVLWTESCPAPTLGVAPSGIHVYTVEVNGLLLTEIPHSHQTSVIPVASIDVDFGRKMAAAQFDVVLDNEAGSRGWYQQANPVFVPENPVRVYGWLGPDANRVCIGTGLFDRIEEGRDPKTLTLKARSRMKWLLSQGFRTIGSQSVDDADAIRTEDNGVYLDKTDVYIVNDILDRAGWPAADRDIIGGGLTISEYDLTDKTSWGAQIAGTDRLDTLCRCDLWEDPLGVIHFKPNAVATGDATTPDYGFEVGVDIMALRHVTDDEQRVTRVEVGGPLTSTVPAWKLTWQTTALLHPTGSMFVDAQSGYLYVVDGVTQYLYKLDQSTRKIVAKWSLGPSLSYAPLGLSKDPTDATHFYVLDADWRFGATTHAKVRKFAFSAPTVVVATTNLPDGEWSDMKFDGSHLWLTNFGDGKLYEKTFVGGGTAGATGSWSYAGHTGPSGLYLDGTTIGLFFNGGEAFYKVDTSAPGTITGTQSTKGTHIEGGEIDTVTHTDLYATAAKDDFGNDAGYVWKFQLATEITTDVTVTSIDFDLEDELGFQSGIGDRDHTDCPNDPSPHPFEARPAYVSLKVVASLAQAQDVADTQLALLEALRRVLDLATVGNPALETNDVIGVYDPVSAIGSLWLLDSYKTSVSEAGFVTSLSALPLDVDWVPGS